MHALCQMSTLSAWLVTGVCGLLIRFLRGGVLELFLAAMCIRRKHGSRVQNVETFDSRGLLDLPDLVLDNVLSKLPPKSLSKTATVCKELRSKCSSDHLWLPHVKAKWMKVVGPAAFMQWKSRSSPDIHDESGCKPLICQFSCLWPSLRSKPPPKASDACAANSYMAWYIALETGGFSFPAQVYNRENGHVGFMLSCYDAELSYDRQTDTFAARYPPHGLRSVVMEDGVQWERIRPPPVATPANELHVSDCLHTLQPGDHVEVQWRRNKDFPYGWWYGIVGHSETCNGDSMLCRCHLDGTLWLEFNQYAPGSRWRRAAVNRSTHREEGNDAQGFYAGIRKICSKGEISTWKQLWPKESLE